MRNCFTLAVILVVSVAANPFIARASVNTTYHPVYFATDSFSLTVESQQQLSELIKQLPTTGEVEVYLSGHTDAEGNSQYNQQLSEKRVLAVAGQLVSLGVPEENVHNSFYGESKPASVNNNETGKARNRRVEIAVKHTVVNSIEDIVGTEPSLAPQQFNINTANNQTITGNKGIEITVPADAFVTADGKVITEKNVTVTLTEFMGKADAFFHGVTTMSDKGLLESGGMFNLTASADGRPLQLKPGKNLEVKIPAADLKQDMKLYVTKTGTDGKPVWVETSTAFKASMIPTDTQTISLTREKYSAFLSQRVSLPGLDGLRTMVAFEQAEPVKPVRPHLTLQTERDLKSSGIRYVTTNKNKQRKFLDRLNRNIQVTNQKRKALYEARLATYLADSASYPKRLEEYQEAKDKYSLYWFAKKAEMDSMTALYRDAIMMRRMQSGLRQMITASEKGKLYKGNLTKQLRAYCISNQFMLRDLGWEQQLNAIYGNVLFNKKKKIVRAGFAKPGSYEVFDGYGYVTTNSFVRLMRDPAIQEAMSSLVDDNTYLTAEEKEFQKKGISEGLLLADGANVTLASYYTATVGQLGYVNCDRLSSSENVVAMQVDNLQQSAQSVAFIKGVNSSQNIFNGANRFKKDEDLRLLSVYFESGRPYVAYQEVRMTGAQKVALDYKEMKVDDFKKLVFSFI